MRACEVGLARVYLCSAVATCIYCNLGLLVALSPREREEKSKIELLVRKFVE